MPRSPDGQQTYRLRPTTHMGTSYLCSHIVSVKPSRYEILLKRDIMIFRYHIRRVTMSAITGLVGFGPTVGAGRMTAETVGTLTIFLLGWDIPVT